RLQLDAPGADARYIQKVVHEPRHLPQLSIHDLASGLQLGLGVLGATQERRRIANRRERMSQLMRQGGEKLVLAIFRLPHHAFGVLSLRDVSSVLRGTDDL